MIKSERPIAAERVFGMHEDKYNIAILHENESKYYLDKEHTTEVTGDDLFRMFAMGAIVLKDDTYYKPVSYKDGVLTLCENIPE